MTGIPPQLQVWDGNKWAPVPSGGASWSPIVVNLQPPASPASSGFVCPPARYAEPPPHSVITWETQFNPHGRKYHYAAVRVPDKGWYVTDRYDHAYDWHTLNRVYIGNASVYLATTWAQLAVRDGIAP